MVRRILVFGLAALLLTGLGYQIYGAAQTLDERFQNKLLDNRNLDAFARSADASYGDNFAASISFFRASIPAQATVLIPPGEGTDGPLNDKFLMQYLLFPRTIETCLSDCRARLAKPGTYIISVGDFPSPALVPATKHLVSFAGSPRLYVPGK